MVPAGWPSLLRPLVQKYGPSDVYFRGMRALGYPPDFVSSDNELKIVEDFLRSN